MAAGWWFEVRGSTAPLKWLVGINDEQRAARRLAEENGAEARITRLREASVVELEHYGVEPSSLRQV